MSQSASTLNSASSRPHPPVESWIDYFAGSVPGEQADSLSRHLSHCRRCIDLVLDLDGFATPPPPRAGGAADFEKAAVWHTLKSALTPRAASRARRWLATAAAAASLLFAAVGLSAWTQQRGELRQLRSQVAAFPELVANPVIVNLRPDTRERGASGSAAAVDLGGGSRMLVPILNLAEEVDFARYQVRIHDSSGAEVTRFADLEISDLGNFRLALLPGMLEAGRYELRLVGLAGDAEQLIHTYPLQLR